MATGGRDGEAQQPQLPADALGPMAHFGQAGVSPDGRVAYSTVLFEGKSFSDLPTEKVAAALTVIKGANDQDGLTVGANGIFGFVQGEPPSSESIGVGVALFILLFAFGSILGAFLPIVSAALSVSITTALVLPIVANYFSVATFAPFLASMIGLGVGIDYSLFVINRYREAMRHGRDPRSAALESVRTSGRAVQFAALTVIIALLGLFVMRIEFFNGIAVSAAITVFMVMLGACSCSFRRCCRCWAAGRSSDGWPGSPTKRRSPSLASPAIAHTRRTRSPLRGVGPLPARDHHRLALAPDRAQGDRRRASTIRARSRGTASGCSAVRGRWPSRHSSSC